MNPGMTDHRQDWSDRSEGERHYGDITNVKADKYGRYQAVKIDNKINLFGRWSIFGKMCDVHLPKGEEEEDRLNDNDLP